MRDLIIAIFGQYTPVSYTVYNAATDSYDTVIAQGFSGVDWPYILGVFGFFMCLYCVLRIIGALIAGGNR